VQAQVWSATSFTELQREGTAVERHNRLHPANEPRTSFVEDCLGTAARP